MGLDNAIIEMVLKKYLFVKNYVLDVLGVLCDMDKLEKYIRIL